jgi:tight adherence protein B
MIAGELWLIYALAFGATLLGVQALYWVLYKERRDQKTINRRLALTAQLSSPADVLDVLRRERGADILARVPSLQNFKELIVQSGVRLSVPGLLLSVGLLAVLFYLLLWFATGSGLLALTLAVPLAVAAIYLFLQRARRRRIAAFTAQLPDALDVIVRGLRAGHPFRVALGIVAREMPDPVGSEFGIVADEIMFGLAQSAAIDNLLPRVGLADLSFFSTAVNIQNQTGGNLAEILTRLSRMLRSRSKLRLKIRALSAEGRLSAIALSLMPFMLFLIISFLSPDYFSVTDHWLFTPAIFLGAFLLIIGNFALYKMVNFKF